MAKKAKKAKKTTLRKVSVKTLESILIECALATGRGVGANVKISDSARKYWHSHFKRTIKRALAIGERWSIGRRIVLPLATQMGGHAAKLATNGVILKPAAVTAAKTISDDPACPPFRGKFCS